MKAPTTLAEAQNVVDNNVVPPMFDDPYANYLVDVAMEIVNMGEWDALQKHYIRETQINQDQRG